MPALKEKAREEEDRVNVQLIISKLARNQLTEADAQRQLEEIWERAYHDSWLRDVIRRLLPSLSAHRG